MNDAARGRRPAATGPGPRRPAAERAIVRGIAEVFSGEGGGREAGGRGGAANDEAAATPPPTSRIVETMATAATELLCKYEAIHRLRSAPAGPTGSAPPRAELRALADRYPGALRELDELTMVEIERRLGHLRALVTGRSSAAEAWVGPLWLFHRRLRGALAAKRWLRGRRHVSSIDRAALEARGELGGGEARAWAAHLAELARPPTGRVTDVVFEHVAAELNLPVESLATLVLGARARRHARKHGERAGRGPT
jgi:hypothetical protein